MTVAAQTSEAWIVDLAVAEARMPACLAVLDADERARAERFLRAADRKRFIVGHAAWRFVLGHALGADPRTLAFAVGPSGKPELAGPWSGLVDINLSHSGERAVVGLATIGRIGVDIEASRPLPDALRIARHHFAPSEVVALERCSAFALHHAFLACWTRKEAVVKAMGVGLSMPLDRFAVTVPPGPVAVLDIAGDREAARAWSLHHLEPAPGYVGAVAIAAPEAPCRIHTLPLDWVDALS